jgi:hypothetical protein
MKQKAEAIARRTMTRKRGKTVIPQLQANLVNHLLHRSPHVQEWISSKQFKEIMEAGRKKGGETTFPDARSTLYDHVPRYTSGGMGNSYGTYGPPLQKRKVDGKMEHALHEIYYM